MPVASESLSCLLERLPGVLGEHLEEARWSMEPSLGPEGFRLEIGRLGEDSPLLRIVLEPKQIGARDQYFSSTEKFFLYYIVSPGARFEDSDRPRLERLMEAVRRVLRRAEAFLTDSGIRATLAACAAPQALPAPTERLHLVTEVAQGPGLGNRAQMFLRVNFRCNQRCPFCFVALSGRQVPLDEIARELDSVKARTGCGPVVVVSGGEPGAHPQLPEIIAMIQRKGFRRIMLQTNGVYFSKQGRVKRLGHPGYFVSFHSHLPEVYNRLTGTRGQYPLALEGIRNILRMGSPLTLNIVLNRRNYEHLPDYVDFVSRLAEPFRRKFHIFFSLMNDPGHLKCPELAVSLAEISSPLNAALERCAKRGVAVCDFAGDCAVPLCVLGDPARHAGSRCPQRDVQTLDLIRTAGISGRVKNPSCKRCVYDARCRGISAAYFRRFGAGELVPVLGRRPRRSRAS